MLLLSLGARLYVAMALLSLLALHSSRNDGISAMRLFVYLLMGVVAFGAIGVLRQTSLDGLASVGLNIALEPLLTSISLFTLRLTILSFLSESRICFSPTSRRFFLPFYFPASPAFSSVSMITDTYSMRRWAAITCFFRH